MDFMDLKLHLWLIRKTLKTHTHTHTHTQKHKNKEKERKEIHTFNSLNGRFDKDFYYGFHKHQIA